MEPYKQARLSLETHKELRVFAAMLDLSASKAIMLLLKESKTRADAIQKAHAPSAPQTTHPG